MSKVIRCRSPRSLTQCLPRGHPARRPREHGPRGQPRRFADGCHTAVRLHDQDVARIAACAQKCGSETKVTRVDSGLVTDLSGRWNDTDSRQVAEAMVNEALHSPGSTI